MEIIKNITNRNKSVRTSRNIKYIVIHFVGAVSSAKANATYFKNEYRGASAHYFVDDNEIVQVVEDKDVAWHCGANYYRHLNCRNSNSVGIEMCCFRNNGKLDISEKVIAKTVELTKELMKKYNIPVQNVIRHYDVTGKNCPAPFVENSARWHNFISRISQTTSNKFAQGQAVEINIPMYYTEAEENGRFLYDNKTQLVWIGADTRSLIKNDNLIARAIVAWVEEERVLVQVFNDQFWIKTNEAKAL